MKNFNERFEDYKLSISGLSSLSDEAFTHWQKNYVATQTPLKLTDFLAGKIYSIFYNDQMEKNKKFINRRPVIFFMGFFNQENKVFFSGIDLILIPPEYRLGFFIRISSVYESTINSNIEREEKGNLLDQSSIKCDYNTMEIIMKGIPWKNSYRAWDLQKIGDTKEITYSDWTRMIYLHTRSIEGTPIEEIYKKNSII